ncbi:MAG TPA: signal peptidase I [Acetobacteraceae bacterium]|nr:signal peptidase I [Acetobacteraceae bacterium]
MSKKKSGGLLEGFKTIFYAALIAIGIRTVAFEPFSIPSGSMIPTLLVGDYLFVSKYSYGYSRHSLPFSPNLFSGRIFGSTPQRGDVAVFKLPRDGSTDYIKRIIGLPGDRISVRGGVLHVNGQAVRRERIGPGTAEGDGPPRVVTLYRETLPGGREHLIAEESDEAHWDNAPCELYDRNQFRCLRVGEFVVPAGHVFAMGDNRDNSTDSRADVGFIPIENLVGRAEFIFFSVDGSGRIRWWEVWNWPFAIRWSRLLSGIR